MTEWNLDLLTGRITVPTDAEKVHEDRMTALTKQRLGWVPECGCPVHDR